MLDQTQPLVDINTAAGRLLGGTLISARPAVGGGNNRVYRVETSEGIFAIKFYPRQDADPRDRLGQEFTALELMGQYQIGCVPKAIKCDTALNCAVYEWVDGTVPGQIGDADVDAMTDFAGILASLAEDPSATIIQPASASCFAAADSVRQFDARLARLQEVADDRALDAFIQDHLLPGSKAFANRARHAYAAAGLDFDAPLMIRDRTLSPSDFGFHNAIRRADTTLAFLDFEYFGWDDPVKMIADAIWHPGSAMSAKAATRFQGAMLDFFAARNGEALRIRYDALCPLFGIIWCLIVLNEFLPERWARRVAAGSTEDAINARARQLRSASELFTRVTEQHHD